MSAFTLPSQDPAFRHFSFIVTPYPSNTCEMGDAESDDECSEQPTFWLNAPGSYVKPTLVCATHAAEENFYYGTPFPEGRQS